MGDLSRSGGPAAETRSGGGLAAPEVVLFDLDDTLYPEHQFVDGGFRAVAGLLAGLSDRSEPALTERLWALHRVQGRGRLFDTLLAELGLDAPELVPACVLRYRTHPPRLRPFPGVVDLLDGLRGAGIRCGLVSDGNAAVQARKLAALPDVAGRLDVEVFTDLLGPGLGKPSPVGYRVACLLLGVAPGRAVYVGNDPRKDFAGARAAGLASIRVGAVPDEGGAGGVDWRTSDDADRAVESIDDLGPLLLPTAPAPTDPQAPILRGITPR
jgi:putative hydrolase of the HAD superfamily